MKAPRWHYALLSTACLIAAAGLCLLLVSGCSVRQRLHIATAADLVTTHQALQIDGAYEANPLYSGNVAQMAVTSLALNEAVLWWERSRCKPAPKWGCSVARSIRLGMTAGHATGGIINGVTVYRHRDD